MKYIIFNNIIRVLQQILVIFIFNIAIVSTLMSQELMENSINDCKDLSIDNIKNFSITINNIVWPIIFEDENYTKDLLNFIVNDLQMIYSRYVDYQLKVIDNETFNIQGCFVKSYEYLQFTHDLPIPDEIHFSFYSIIKLKNKKYLVIPKKLIEIYKKAYHFKMANIEKFNKLLKFIDYLNQIKSLDKITKKEIKNLYFTGLLSEEEKKMFFPDNADKEFLMKFSYKNIKFYSPSILAIYMGEHENKSKRYFMVDIPFYIKNNNLGGGWPFIYSNNKWQLALFLSKI